MELNSPVANLPGVGSVYAKRLKRLEIATVKDLLYHVPSRYLDFRGKKNIADIKPGETVTVQGKLLSIKNLYTKVGKKIQLAEIEDETGKAEVVWFNQPFLVRTLKKGSIYSLSGKAELSHNKTSLVSPEYELVSSFSNKTLHTGRLVPVYPETSGVSSKWLRTKISTVLPLVLPKIKDPLPQSILDDFNLIPLARALEKIHFPKSLQEAGAARYRLSFDEILNLNLRSLYRKSLWQKTRTAYKLKISNKMVDSFVKSLPFDLTPSQIRSIEEIIKDLEKEVPMNRLLEGDVGSGKTVVAALASFITFLNGFKTAFMAPTQILAEQHFNTLKNLLGPFKVRIKLLTSSVVKSDLGNPDIIVGTHALIHKASDLENVGLVVIDEQHRFGVEQRTHLIRLSGTRRIAPHVLTMTATPIPRTIALTVHGDLNLSTLTELPAGRKPIETWIVPQRKREAAYNWIQEQIVKEKVQAFVICPLIEESEKETMRQVKAAKSEYEKLLKLFPDLKIGLLHGKQKSDEKNKVLSQFKKGEIDILVSTPVVEVGIDIPNAAIMVIEAAERFGLAQLHQLRGRIGRGSKKSYCLLFTEKYSQKSIRRLNALKKTASGFELAEIDLKLRGPGEVFGTKQHGYPDLKIASWQDTSLIRQTREAAEKIFRTPEKYKKLLSLIKKTSVELN